MFQTQIMPTETVELPSKGLLYSESSPLSKGTVELKYMTAKEEDILTNQNFLKNGTVIDKLLQALIVTPGVDYEDLLDGDKDAIMLAARILAYGSDYTFVYDGNTHSVDLSSLDPRPLHEDFISANNKNEFAFILPHTQTEITFKLLTQRDEKLIDRELAGLKKIKKDDSSEVTTRLKHVITSVNGDYTVAAVRKFVDQGLLSRDARALREYYAALAPIMDMTYFVEGSEEAINIPITVNFFWPDYGK